VGKDHLLGLLEKVENSPFRLFILERDGVLIGADHDYARQIARFESILPRGRSSTPPCRQIRRKTDL